MPLPVTLTFPQKLIYINKGVQCIIKRPVHWHLGCLGLCSTGANNSVHTVLQQHGVQTLLAPNILYQFLALVAVWSPRGLAKNRVPFCVLSEVSVRKKIQEKIEKCILSTFNNIFFGPFDRRIVSLRVQVITFWD